MTDEKQKQIISKNLNKLINGEEQKKIALDLGVNPPTFNQWVKGKALPSITNLVNLADYFGVPLLAIVSDSDTVDDKMSVRVAKRYERAPEYVRMAINDLLKIKEK